MSKSAAEITATIRQTLEGKVIPANPMCVPGDACITLSYANEVMKLLAAIDDANEGNSFEFPGASGRAAMDLIRRMVRGAVEYSIELSEGEGNLRAAFDRGEMGRAS
jgi:hypothetical protein